MTGALDSLVEGLFDYAGMYPPASLSLEEALKTSASFPGSLKRPGLVGADLVLDAEKAAAIGPEALGKAGFPRERPFRACLLGSPLRSPAHDFSEDLARLQSFEAGGGDAAPRKALSYEFKLQLDGRIRREDLRGLIAGSMSFPADILLFVEPDLARPDFADVLRELCAALSELNARGEGPRVGLKVRAAGPTAADPARMARAIMEVCRRGLPFKATAGLHHPFPEKGRAAGELGFLACLSALLLARSLGLGVFPEEAALRCLRAGKDDFRFDEGLTWEKLSLSLERALEAKAQAHFSIGSCSLHEPDEDLVRLFGQ